MMKAAAAAQEQDDRIEVIINLRYRYLLDGCRENTARSPPWKYFNNETKFRMYKFSAIASSFSSGSSQPASVLGRWIDRLLLEFLYFNII